MSKIALALVFLSVWIPLRAQEPDGQTRRSAFRSAGSREDISVLAGDMLKATNEARLQIKEGNKSAALRDVMKAQSYLQQVEAHSHGSTMIPVYQEFVSVSILSPIQAVQQQKKATTVEKLPQSETNASVQEVSGNYTSVVVNTTVARDSLDAAKKALEANDLRTADSALQDVQEGVQITMTQADLPLVQVRENLILARKYARMGDWTGSQNALLSAVHALKEYEKEQTTHQQDAVQLERQISAYTHGLATNHAGILDKINHWWNETADWTQYQLKSAS
jgi:hypothetical protein